MDGSVYRHNFVITAQEMEPYKALCTAIIIRAIKDYKEASAELADALTQYDIKYWSGKREEVLNFFSSDWFLLLSGLSEPLTAERLDKIDMANLDYAREEIA